MWWSKNCFVHFQNLDVNLAVNNLLSRDDEDGDDQEEGESYMSGGGKQCNWGKSI